MSDSEKPQISISDEQPQASNRNKTAAAEAGSSLHRQEHHVAEEPSGYRGENPSTAGPGNTGIRSATPENARGTIDPSSPGDTGTTPGSTPQE